MAGGSADHMLKPVAEEQVRALFGQMPPQRDLRAFVAALRDHRLAHEDPVVRMTRVLDRFERSRRTSLAPAELGLFGLTQGMDSAQLEQAVAVLNARWPEPDAGEARVMGRIRALLQLTRARDAGQLTDPQHGVLTALLRLDRPPLDVGEFFDDWMGRLEPCTAADLRSASAALPGFAPDAHRLIGRDAARLAALWDGA